ncbi:MAG: hypothetical protein ACRD1N_11855 [Terriglobia bacterium]
MHDTQLELMETFATAKPPRPLFCHEQFLEKLANESRSAVGRRAVFLMQRMAVGAARLHYKPTHGVNRGWRRSRLGGNQGSHFYAWWAPEGAAPVKQFDGFSAVPQEAIFLRDIRHHDDHSPLSPGSFKDHYLPISVSDLRREEYGPEPWTPPQVRFASARYLVKLLKGHPGSGKTTALWHAADSSGAERVLYVTYSQDLAALARDYFDRFCSSHKLFHVVTYPALLRQLLSLDAPSRSPSELRRKFAVDLAPFNRSFGPWAHCLEALYDELHAHRVGDALPVAIGRFRASKLPRAADKDYRERRTKFLGPAATSSVLDLAARLERADGEMLADRYFPELALAWRAAARLDSIADTSDFSWIDFGCVAVDEAQDLTPIEVFVLVKLALLINSRKRRPVSMLWAGDEAQTVRPTDFEWGWLSDLLHARVSTPSEYTLAANLRSPRRIAEIVNRVWDLYSEIDRQDRPSGSGHAEVDDDAADQVLYCSAMPGPELDQLFLSLAAREGVALIATDEIIPSYIPEPARSAVLTVSEAKGLDFHSVCVINAGQQLDRILQDRHYSRRDSDLESLRKRLCIDRLRVALSRPAERLLWMDVSPTESIVRQSLDFLNETTTGGEVSSTVPAAILKTLEEDELDTEERVQRCQADARQYIDVKPEMAWSRAQQAITLLGRPGSPAAVTDEAARRNAYLTLAEVCFKLAMWDGRLRAELGRPNLFNEAERAAVSAGRPALATVISAVAGVQRAPDSERLNALAWTAETLPRHKNEVEPWLTLEIAAKAGGWVETLESALISGRNAAVLIRLLPPFYEALGLPDRPARTERLQQRAIQVLIKDKQFASALAALRALPERQPKLEAICHEGLGDSRLAAESYRATGNLKEALNCYRAIPDLDAALSVSHELGDHPAAASLEWMAQLSELISKRPEKFSRVMTAGEKQLLRSCWSAA